MIIYRYLTKESKSGVYKPKICIPWSRCVERIGKHVSSFHKLSGDEKKTFLKTKVKELEITITCDNAPENVAEENENEDEEEGERDIKRG